MLQCARLESTPLRRNTPAICLKKIETRCKRGEECGDKVEETGGDKGGKQ